MALFDDLVLEAEPRTAVTPRMAVVLPTAPKRLFDDIVQEAAFPPPPPMATEEAAVPMQPAYSPETPTPPPLHPDLKFDDVATPSERTPPPAVPLSAAAPSTPVGGAALTPRRPGFLRTVGGLISDAAQFPLRALSELPSAALPSGDGSVTVPKMPILGTAAKAAGMTVGSFGADAVIPMLRGAIQTAIKAGPTGQTPAGQAAIERLNAPTGVEEWWAKEQSDYFNQAMKEQGAGAAVAARVASDVFKGFGSTALILAGSGAVGGGGRAHTAASKLAKAQQLAAESAKFAALTWATTPGDEATRIKAAEHAAAMVALPGAASFIPSALVAKVAAGAVLSGLSIPAYKEAIEQATQMDAENGKGFWPNFTATALGMTLMNLVFAAATPGANRPKALRPSETPPQTPAVAPGQPTASEAALPGVLTRPPVAGAVEGTGGAKKGVLRPMAVEPAAEPTKPADSKGLFDDIVQEAAPTAEPPPAEPVAATKPQPERVLFRGEGAGASMDTYGMGGRHWTIDPELAANYGTVREGRIKPNAKILILDTYVGKDRNTWNTKPNEPGWRELDALVKPLGYDRANRAWGNQVDIPADVAQAIRKAGYDVIQSTNIEGPETYVLNPDVIEDIPSRPLPSPAAAGQPASAVTPEPTKTAFIEEQMRAAKPPAPSPERVAAKAEGESAEKKPEEGNQNEVQSAVRELDSVSGVPRGNSIPETQPQSAIIRERPDGTTRGAIETSHGDEDAANAASWLARRVDTVSVLSGLDRHKISAIRAAEKVLSDAGFTPWETDKHVWIKTTNAGTSEPPVTGKAESGVRQPAPAPAPVAETNAKPDTKLTSTPAPAAQSPAPAAPKGEKVPELMTPEAAAKLQAGLRAATTTDISQSGAHDASVDFAPEEASRKRASLSKLFGKDIGDAYFRAYSEWRELMPWLDNGKLKPGAPENVQDLYVVHKQTAQMKQAMDEIGASKRVISDWSSREYKDTSLTYDARDMYGQDKGKRGVKGANERRRAAVVQNNRQQIKDNEDLIRDLQKSIEERRKRIEERSAQSAIDEALKDVPEEKRLEAILKGEVTRSGDRYVFKGETAPAPAPVAKPVSQAAKPREGATATEQGVTVEDALNRGLPITVPKGATMVRVTIADGRQAVLPVARVKEFADAGPFTKVEAGIKTVAKKGQDSFKPMAEPVTVKGVELKPVAKETGKKLTPTAKIPAPQPEPVAAAPKPVAKETKKTLVPEAKKPLAPTPPPAAVKVETLESFLSDTEQSANALYNASKGVASSELQQITMPTGSPGWRIVWNMKDGTTVQGRGNIDRNVVIDVLKKSLNSPSAQAATQYAKVPTWVELASDPEAAQKALAFTEEQRKLFSQYNREKYTRRQFIQKPTKENAQKMADAITAPAAVKVETTPEGKTLSVPAADKPGLPPKEQKKYLLAELDKAIQQAPKEPEALPARPERPQVEKERDRLNKAEERTTKRKKDAGIEDLPAYNATKEEKAEHAITLAMHDQATVNELADLMKKYDIPEKRPAYAGYKNMEGGITGAEPEREIPPSYRLGLLREKLNSQLEPEYATVTVEVPGDGTFTLRNDKATLSDFRDKAKKFPTTPTKGEKWGPKEPPAPTTIAKVGERPAGSDKAAWSEIMQPIASTDERRVVLQRPWIGGDGAMVATDGRRMVVALGFLGKAETKVNGGTPPNWTQVIPNYKKGSLPEKVKGETDIPITDTAKMVRQLRQAATAIGSDTINTVRLYAMPDGTIAIAANHPDVGSYTSVDVKGGKLLGSYNIQFVEDMLTFLRKAGNEKVTLRLTDELSPAVFLGKREYGVLMPMRVEGADTPGAFERTPSEPSSALQPRPGPGDVVPPDLLDRAEAAIDAAIADAKKEQGKRLSSGVDPTLMVLWTAKGAVKLARGARDFAAWSADMVKEFGATVKPYLGIIWADIRAYKPGRLERNLQRIIHGPKGALPSPLRPMLEAKEGYQLGHQTDLKLSIDDTRRTLEAEFSKSNKVVRDMMRDDLLAYWNGEKPLPAGWSPDLQAKAKSFRDKLDTMSQLAIDNDWLTPSMAETWKANKGQWMKRFYRAFDPSEDWNYDELKRRYVRGDKEVRRVWDEAADYIARENPELGDVEVDGIMRQLVDRVVSSPGGGGDGGKMRIAIGSLMRRKELAPELRAWMGEVTDPYAKALQSARWMSQFLAKSRAQQEMREIAIETGLLSERPEGANVVKMFPSETDIAPTKDENGEIMRPEDGENGDILAHFAQRPDLSARPLQNTYGTPEMQDALQRTFAPQAEGYAQNQVADSILKAYFGLVHWTKRNLVPLNPGSWSVNSIGGVAMVTANGNVTMLPEAVGVYRAGRGSDRPATPQDAAKRQLYQLAAQNGLLGESILMRDVESATRQLPSGDSTKHILQNAGSALRGIAADPGRKQNYRDVYRAVGDLLDKPGEIFIKHADDIARLATFLGELKLAKKAFPSMSAEKQAEWAANRAKDMYQTYSRLPAAIRGASQVGALNTFVSFTFELARNTFNIGKYSGQDLLSGNPVLRASAIKRLAWLTAILAATTVAQTLSKKRHDIDDQDEEDIRAAFVQPWDRYADLYFMGVDRDENTVAYSPMSYLLPHADLMQWVKAGIKAGKSDEPAKEFGDIVGAMLAQVGGPGAILGPTLEAALNVKMRGSGKVSYAEGVQGAKERAKYFAEKTLVPRIAIWIRDLNRGLRGEKGDYGKVYDPKMSGANLLGLRPRNYNYADQAVYKLRELSGAWRMASAYENNAKFRWPDDPDKLDAAKTYAEERQQELLEEATKLGEIYNRWNMDLDKLRKATKGLPVELRARIWAEQDSVRANQSTFYPSDKYQQLKYALKDKKPVEVRTEIRKILADDGMTPSKLKDAMRQSLQQPFTGSQESDSAFYKALSPAEKAKFDTEKKQRLDMLAMLHGIMGSSVPASK